LPRQVTIRDKEYEESIATLMNLKANEVTGEELFFLSMAHQQAGNEVEAQAYFDKAETTRIQA
jgi:hypothetical protein